jgi:hypothetical protein
VRIAEDATTDVKDQRAVPTDQGGKGNLVSAGDEPIQELGVAQPILFERGRQSADLPCQYLAPGGHDEACQVS